jgi:hypothetical protein
VTLSLFSTVAFAAPRAGVRTKPFTLEKGRVVVAEMQKPRKRGYPTLFFLPGMGEKIPLSKPALIDLVAQGFGVVSMNFSTQSPAIALMAEGEVPVFRQRTFTIEDFAWEVEELAKALRKNEGFEDLIPVSISFSASATAQLKSFPFIIETSPLTSAASANPVSDTYRKMLEGINAFNFFSGAQAVRQGMDISYRNFWLSHVNTEIEQNGYPSERREDMIEGYISMSRAAEGFNVEGLNLPKIVRRHYLIAGNEEPLMKRHQLKFIEHLKSEGYPVSIEELSEAEHRIMDTPIEYAAAIAKAALDFNCQRSLRAKSN